LDKSPSPRSSTARAGSLASGLKLELDSHPGIEAREALGYPVEKEKWKKRSFVPGQSLTVGQKT
jgi:hypothetical protein